MRVLSWNVRRASAGSAVWQYFDEISPDVALLQEVTSIPIFVASEYQAVMRQASGNRFQTAILVRGTIGKVIQLSSSWDWVNRELELFEGNLLAHSVTVRGRDYHALSVYSPAWPVDPARLRGIDVAPVKLKLNPKVWVTELLWAALRNRDTSDGATWIVGGDLNASETFDQLWPGGPRGNREILDRMADLGFVECLRQAQGALVPTFRNPRNGQIVHQMDHLFVSRSLSERPFTCRVGDSARVFDAKLSDHLPIVAEFSDSCPTAV